MRYLTTITRVLVASYAISKSGAFTSSFVRRGDLCRPCSRQSCNVESGKSLPLSMALEVKIRIVGRKGAEKWLDDGYAMYEKRLRPAGINVQTHYHKNDNDLVKGVTTDDDKNHSVVLLDPLGRVLTSEKFADDLYNWFDEGGSRLTFVIGELRDCLMNYGVTHQSLPNKKTDPIMIIIVKASLALPLVVGDANRQRI